MASKCPKCAAPLNGNLKFCNQCGAAIDADVRLILELENLNKKPGKVQSGPVKDDDDYVPIRRREKKNSPLPWIILGVAAIAVVLWLVL